MSHVAFCSNFAAVICDIVVPGAAVVYDAAPEDVVVTCAVTNLLAVVVSWDWDDVVTCDVCNVVFSVVVPCVDTAAVVYDIVVPDFTANIADVCGTVADENPACGVVAPAVVGNAPVVDDAGVVELGESEVPKLVITGKEDVPDTEVLDCVVSEDMLVAVVNFTVIVVLDKDAPAAEVLPGIIVLGKVVPTVDIVMLEGDVTAAAEVTDFVLLFEVDV